MIYSKPQIKAIERRSIELYNPIEGPQSLPISIDRLCFRKTTKERELLRAEKIEWKTTVPVGYRPKTIAKA